MDFSTPSVKQFSDFFMYLYQDINRRPLTIDGYRKAIVDTLGPAKLNISQSIRPATLSSWLKQTILLCYKQADHQALDLVQVKVHDIRAFAASKAFHGGVSVD